MISRVGVVHKNDFSITFRDVQNLERLHKKLLQAHTILESNIDVVSAFISSQNQSKEKEDKESMECAAQLEAYARQTKNHLRTAGKFLAISKGVSRMVSHWSLSRFVLLILGYAICPDIGSFGGLKSCSRSSSSEVTNRSVRPAMQ